MSWQGFFGVALVVISVLYILVCIDERQKTILGRTKMFVWYSLPDLIKKGARKVCGNTIVTLIERLINYIINENNPLVQIVYFIIAVGGYYLYVINGFPRVPNDYIGNYHKYIASVIMFLCYWSYVMACITDPGKVPTTRHEHSKVMKRFKLDGALFEKKNKCSTCKVDKPARSKHCKQCKICIQKHD